MNVTWKDIDGYEGLYKVSSIGEVFSNRANKIMKPESMKKGYLRVGLNKEGKRERIMLHRLVMYTFDEYRPYPEWEVNHKDMNPLNNNFSNLEWMTLEDNMAHRYLNKPEQKLEASKRMSKVGKEFYMLGVEASKKKVARLDKDTHRILETYESAREASKQGYNYKNISQVCLGEKKTHRGFKWEFV